MTATPPIAAGEGVRVRPAAVGLSLAALAALLATISIAQSLVFGGDPPVARLNLDTEDSVQTWFQGSLLLFAGGLTALVGVARSHTGERYPRYWLAAGAVLAYMSLDELTAIHEELIDPISDAFGTRGLLHYGWVIPGALVAAAFARVYFKVFLALPARMRTLLLTAAVLYLTGALGVEAIDGAYVAEHGVATRLHYVLSDVEEGLEMAGLVVLVYGLVWLLAQMKVSLTSTVTHATD